MRLAALLVLLLTVGCAHAPTPLPGPRPLGNDASLTRNEATLTVRYRYEVRPDRKIDLLIDLAGQGVGTVGNVELAVSAEGMTVEGEATWSGPIESGTAMTHRVRLNPTGSYGEVTVKYAITNAVTGEPAVFRFMITDDETRPCQPSEEGCKPGP
jgi:hypothetical protein